MDMERLVNCTQSQGVWDEDMECRAIVVSVDLNGVDYLMDFGHRGFAEFHGVRILYDV